MRFKIDPGRVPDALPTEVHQSPCENCPSQINYRMDPESEDILKSGDKQIIIESRFSCGWRPHKLCKGYEDRVNAALEQLK